MSKKNQVGQMLHIIKRVLGGKVVQFREIVQKKKKTRKGNKNNIWILIQTLMHDKRK